MLAVAAAMMMALSSAGGFKLKLTADNGIKKTLVSPESDRVAPMPVAEGEQPTISQFGTESKVVTDIPTIFRGEWEESDRKSTTCPKYGDEQDYKWMNVKSMSVEFSSEIIRFSVGHINQADNGNLSGNFAVSWLYGDDVKPLKEIWVLKDVGGKRVLLRLRQSDNEMTLYVKCAS